MNNNLKEKNNNRSSGESSFKNDDLFGDAFKGNPGKIGGTDQYDKPHLNMFNNCNDKDDDLLFLGERLPSNYAQQTGKIECTNFISMNQEPIDINSNTLGANKKLDLPILPNNNCLLDSLVDGICDELEPIIPECIGNNAIIEINSSGEDEDIDVIFQGVIPGQSGSNVDIPLPKSNLTECTPRIPNVNCPPNLHPISNANENNIAKVSDKFLHLISNANGGIMPFVSGKMVPNMFAPQNNIPRQSTLTTTYPMDISTTVEDDDDDDEADDHTKRLSTFFEYKPMKFKYGKSHPDQVVETSAMAVVEPPDVSYNLQMLGEIFDTSSLSSLQLEAIAYACQRHETFLESGERAAFFLGDGPGVGKGRIIAGIIHENKLWGREKALWLSVSSDLRFDAIRDLTDVQCHLNVIPLNKVSYNEYISDYEGYAEDGVLFSTYSSLIGTCNNPNSMFRSRLDQIIDWCGDDFDGVVIFDECHKAKNLLPTPGGKSTKTGLAVLELQKRLPNSRIVYCSATGATEPKNLGYMYRLGLWGPGTPFLHLNDFIRAVERRGVGGMEIVAMDMKLRGMYIARQLSFSGVTFRIHEVELSPKFKLMYNRSVQLWEKILTYSEKAVTMCGITSKNSAFYWAKFWSYHQRFFKYLCIASKVKAVTELTRKALKDGKCVIIGLQSTGESHISENDCNLERIVSTASGVLTALVEKSFPIPSDLGSNEGKLYNQTVLAGPKYQGDKMKRPLASFGSLDEDDEFVDVDEDVIIVDDDGNIDIEDSFEGKKAKYGYDNSDQRLNLQQNEVLAAAGLPSCKYSWGTSTNLTKTVAQENLNLSSTQICLRWRQELLDEIENLQNELPPNTLDELIDQLGGVDHVSEMTGRKGRIVRIRDDFYTYKSRGDDELPLEYVNISERSKFMNGEKLVAIISEAASAGISLQADRRCSNHRKRVHITLELPWSADKAVQQFGRSHRSNQLYPPEYVFVISQLAGEKRFASSVAKRLESLGALTHGDRRAGETRDLSQYNFENKYGRMALHYMLNLISNDSKSSSIPPPKYDSSKNFFDDALDAMKKSGLSGLLKSNIFDSIGDGNLHLGPNMGSTSIKSSAKISRFLNRILGIEVDLQNAIFTFYTSILSKIVKDQKKAGKWDSGILDWGVTGENVIINDKSKFTIHSKNSDSIVELIQVFIERGTEFAEALNIYHTSLNEGDGFYAIDKYKNQQSIILVKKVNNLSFNDSYQSEKPIDNNVSTSLYTTRRPNLGESAKTETLESIRKRYTLINESLAKTLWEAQYNLSLNQCTHLFRWGKCAALSKNGQCDHGKRRKMVYILSGAIFGIWNIIEETFGETPIRIVRVSTSDGYRKIGIIVHQHLVDVMKSKLHQASVNSFKSKMSI